MRTRLAKLQQAVLGISLFLVAGVASAIPIVSISPAQSNVNVGDVFTVDLVWDASSGGELVGAWDLNITFDQAIIDYRHAGSASGGFLGFGIWDGTDSNGVANQAEISFESPADLEALQNGAGNQGVLGRFQFEALADGQAALGITINAIGDEFGNSLQIQTQGGRVCVGSGACGSPMPEPGTLPAIALCLLGLVLLHRRNYAMAA